MNDSNIIKNNICRVCFQVHYNGISLYSEKDGCTPFEKLASHTKLKIAVNDGGPTTLCGQCFIQLNIYIEFSAKCDKANILLSEYKENQLVDTAEYVHGDQGNLFEDDCIEEKSGNNNKISESSEENKQLSKTKETAVGSNPIKHICQYCSKVFTRKFNLKLHIARHGGAARAGAGGGARRQCPAPGCGRSFTSRTNLDTHIRRHSGERPYACPECGKTFRSTTTLNDHKRIHTGVKPYMCPTCGKQFTTNKLSVHMRTHAPRTHACSACTRRFADARSLREHVTREHAASTAATREHACSLCSARYNHKQSLNKHLRKRHGVKTSPAAQPQTQRAAFA